MKLKNGSGKLTQKSHANMKTIKPKPHDSVIMSLQSHKT